MICGFKASVLHLCLSALVAAFLSVFVFKVWFPSPFWEMTEVGSLFVLIIVVDLILGPMITFLVFSRNKSLAELRLDFGIIILLQAAALAYGVWTIYIIRPVHLVFEYDRFRVVHALDIQESISLDAIKGENLAYYGGPSLLGLRKFKDAEEEAGATIAALQGLSLASRPHLWQPYKESREEVMRVAKPISLLLQRFPNKKAEVDSFAQTNSIAENFIRFLPLIGRRSVWTILINSRNGDVIGFLPIDSF